MGRTSSLQWVAPLQAGEPAKIRVVGIHRRSVLHSQCGDMGIGDQIAASPDDIKILLQQREMIRAGIDGSDMVVTQPMPNMAHGLG